MAVIAASAVAAPAWSANLSKAQEGRAEIAKCYRHCMESGAEYELKSIDTVLRFSDVTGIPGTLEDLCFAAQSTMIYTDACKAECYDIEQAYGVSRSAARTRFLRQYADLKSGLARAGLWVAWNKYPEYGTQAFTTACNRYAYSEAPQQMVDGGRF